MRRRGRTGAGPRRRLGLRTGRRGHDSPAGQTFTDGGQCTANFIFTGAGNTYVGQAAHCAGTGEAMDTNGCDAGSKPLGTPVEITGASRPGTLAYSSWIAMQQRGETNPDACDFNDFALVKIDPADVGKVNPSVPGFGGPPVALENGTEPFTPDVVGAILGAG